MWIWNLCHAKLIQLPKGWNVLENMACLNLSFSWRGSLNRLLCMFVPIKSLYNIIELCNICIALLYIKCKEMPSSHCKEHFKLNTLVFGITASWKKDTASFRNGQCALWLALQNLTHLFLFDCKVLHCPNKIIASTSHGTFSWHKWMAAQLKLFMACTKQCVMNCPLLR